MIYEIFNRNLKYFSNIRSMMINTNNYEIWLLFPVSGILSYFIFEYFIFQVI